MMFVVFRIHILSQLWRLIYVGNWDGKCFFSFNTSNSRGVAILFKNTLPVNINRIKVDITGNFVVLDVTLHEYNITIASLYGPNTDNPIFFADLHKGG